MAISRSASLTGGGKIFGDLTIDGDLTVNGGDTNAAYDEIVNGELHVKITDTNAFLVEKADGTDVFVVDTTNSRVGINSTPSRTFQVDGSASATIATGYFYTNAVHTGVDTQSVVSIRSDNSSSNGNVLHVQGDGTGNLLTLSKDGSDKLTVTHEGNVGIGTASPASEGGGTTLHIAETGGSASAVLTLTGGSGGNGSFTGQIQFNDKDDTDERIAMIGASQSGTGTPPGGKLHFYTQIDGGALTEALNLDASQKATFAGDVTIRSSDTAGIVDSLTLINPRNSGSTGDGTQINFQNTDTVARSAFIKGMSTGTYGQSNVLVFGTSSGTYAPTEKMRIDSSGKVGIGTSSINGVFTAFGTPMTAAGHQTVADIFGNVQQDADKGAGIGLGGRYITDSTSVTAFAEILGVKANNTSSNYEGEMVFKTRVNGGNQTERMRIDGDGNVGIGTTSPGTLLDVVNTSAASYQLSIRGDIDNDGGYVGIQFGYDGDGTAYKKAAIHVEGTGGNVTPDMHFLLNSTASTVNTQGLTDAKLSILNSGNVGIGTATPPFELSLPATKVIGFDFGANSASRSWGFRTDQQAFGDFSIMTSDARDNTLDVYALNISPAGNATFGGAVNIASGLTTTGAVLNLQTNEPSIAANDVLGRINFQAPLEADGADGDARLVGASIHALVTASDFNDAKNTTDLVFSTAVSETATEKMRISSAGNVGIGTTTPTDYHASADDLVIATSGSTGITIVSGTTSQGNIFFADGTSGSAEYAGFVQCLHGSSTLLKLGVNGENKLILDANSRISLSNNDSGTSNTVFGKLAGNALGSGSNYNVAIGEDSLKVADSGESGNVAIGYQAMSAVNDTGSDGNVVIGGTAGTGGAGAMTGVVAIGQNAMNSTAGNAQTGTVAIGKDALTALISGAGNTAIGYLAADNITTGARNTILGYQAMYQAGGTENKAPSADDNIAIGYQSLGGQWNGGADAPDKNIAIGNYSLDAILNNALDNIAIGYNSLTELTGGDNNLAVGNYSGDTLTTGDFCTIVGNTSDVSADAQNQTVIGYGATGVADNSVTLGNADVTKVYMNRNGNGKVVLGTIEFDASQATLSTNANTLDDYEEGDYDATVTSPNGTITLEGAYNRLAYVKIGRSVTVTGLLIVNAVSSPDGFAKISLPFAIGDGTDTSRSSAGAVQVSKADNALSRDFANIGVEGESVIRLYLGDNTDFQSDAAEEIVASTQFYIGFTYQV